MLVGLIFKCFIYFVMKSFIIRSASGKLLRSERILTRGVIGSIIDKGVENDPQIVYHDGQGSQKDEVVEMAGERDE